MQSLPCLSTIDREEAALASGVQVRGTRRISDAELSCSMTLKLRMTIPSQFQLFLLLFIFTLAVSYQKYFFLMLLPHVHPGAVSKWVSV